MLFGTVPADACRVCDHEPRTALEAIIRPALSRSPCVVAFSGGRDSAALLSVAVALARREGYPDPVPVTLEFDGRATREHEWQDLVLRALNLRGWRRLRIWDELDFVGPIAAEGLRQHGLLYPANVHTIVPLAQQAAGGALLTGVGGDDVFGNWAWHDVGALLSGRRRMRTGDVRRLAHALAPRGLRGQVLARREPLTLPWLREPARRQVTAGIARELAGAPRTWSARMAWTGRWRCWRATVRNMQLLAGDRVAVSSPFLSPWFLATLAAAGGRWGWGGRGETMQALFGDVLPPTLLSRRSKAEFSSAFFGPATCRFAGVWDGASGVDQSLVDGEILRHIWRSERPHFLSALALQSAWLARAADSAAAETRPVRRLSVGVM